MSVGNTVGAAEKAVLFAQDFNINLDYSERSIEALEGILDYYSNDLKETHPTDRQIWSMALLFGCYLGEVMLRNGLSVQGYAWAQNNQSSSPILSADSGYTIAPVDKVYKRFINGIEDRVVSFYCFSMIERGNAQSVDCDNGVYANIALRGDDGVDGKEPLCWNYCNGERGIVVEQISYTSLCIKAIMANDNDVLCSVVANFEGGLEGAPCAIYLRDNHPSQVTVYGDEFIFNVDYEKRRASNNQEIPIIGSRYWGADVSLPWKQEYSFLSYKD